MKNVLGCTETYPRRLYVNVPEPSSRYHLSRAPVGLTSPFARITTRHATPVKVENKPDDSTIAPTACVLELQACGSISFG